MATKEPNYEFKQSILNTMSAIPHGKVVTYGQVAAMAGYPGAARGMARVLRTLPRDTELPWYRIINGKGEISIPGQGALVQKERLEAEGVVFLNGKVSMKQYQWDPGSTDVG